MKKLSLLVTLGALLLSGCAGGSGASNIGPHGTDSMLSGNKVEGLYLFKIETNQNVITVHSGGDVKVGM